MIRVGLVQIGDSFGDQFYFPYSVGLLQAYAAPRLPTDFEFSPIIYKRGPLSTMVESLSHNDIVCFSAYLWNHRFSLELAHKIKTLHPKIKIVFGGPQIPEERERLRHFLIQNQFIDIASYGEGELSFLRILENFKIGSMSTVPSIGFFDPEGKFMFNEPMETVIDVNHIPSPYLTGVFDKIMAQNPAEKWQGLLETNRGCPYTCTFCYWGKKTERKVKSFDLERVFKEIDWFSEKKIEFVFCCDANFGLLTRDFDIVKKVAENKKRAGYPNAFSVQNTKNSKKKIFEIHKTLHEYGLQKGVNLALQSLHEETLQFIERTNISGTVYNELQRDFTNNNIITFTDIIIGLPGETYHSFIEGISAIIHNGQHNRIQFANLEILENTEMANEEYRKKYGLETVAAKFESHHATIKEDDGPVESHDLVIATSTMPKEDWVKAKIFSWVVSLTYFGKLLQIPYILLHELGKIPYSTIINAFMISNLRYPLTSSIIEMFAQKARSIQIGDTEFIASPKWLNISWHTDEFTYITLSAAAKLDIFYSEAEEKLTQFAEEIETRYPGMLAQAFRLNRYLLKQPFISGKIIVNVDYNLYEIYQSILTGRSFEVKKDIFQYQIDTQTLKWNDWSEWCRQVVWYGYKKGEYLYNVQEKL